MIYANFILEHILKENNFSYKQYTNEKLISHSFDYASEYQGKFFSKFWYFCSDCDLDLHLIFKIDNFKFDIDDLQLDMVEFRFKNCYYENIYNTKFPKPKSAYEEKDELLTYTCSEIKELQNKFDRLKSIE
jgi:hypothetical protein